jgi:hypothetical protein
MNKIEDLATQYADLMKQIQQDAPEEIADLSNGIFGYDDIKAAFIAGRRSAEI